MTALYSIGDFCGYIEKPLPAPKPDPALHYMLRVRPNREIAVEDKFASRGVDSYLPKEKLSRKTGWNRRLVRTVAIFSGVIFIPDFEADLMRLKAISDDIIGYVRLDREPLKVRPKMMAKIREFEKLLDVPVGQRKRAFKAGQHVMIRSGPFAMYTGYVERLDSKRRLSVLVGMLGRMVLDEDQVEAV
jgi:transcription antitermination factor NusG